MVAKRIITTLMLKNGVLFRTKNFFPDYRYTLNFIDMWSVDELKFLQTFSGHQNWVKTA